MLNLLFQYCPKLVVFDHDSQKLLLCRRTGEADYDAVYSLIGGKMEHGDADIIDAIRREKTEEIGSMCKVRVYPHLSLDVHFVKKDQSRMILPHFYAQYEGGPISLNEEYSDFTWIPAGEIEFFEPKISNIAWISRRLLQASGEFDPGDFVLL